MQAAEGLPSILCQYYYVVPWESCLLLPLLDTIVVLLIYISSSLRFVFFQFCHDMVGFDGMKYTIQCLQDAGKYIYVGVACCFS